MRASRSGLALLLASAGVIAAQEAPRGATRVSPGGTTRVFVMAGFDAACKATPYPQITVSIAPSKGQVSFRQGQETVVQYSVSGSCIGTRVQGVGIYYTARPDGEGPDTFTISARLAGGETAERTFKLTIAD